MRAPTIPEAHLAAVVLLTVAAGVAFWLAPSSLDPAIWPASGVAGALLAIWLRWAWLTLRLQRRVLAAYTERVNKAAGLPVAGMTPEGLRQALGVEGRPATRPARDEEQEQ